LARTSSRIGLLLIAAVIATTSAATISQAKEDLVVGKSPAGYTLHARRVALGDILRALAQQAHLEIKSDLPLTERVDIELQSGSLPSVLQRLLRNHSYGLRFYVTAAMSDQQPPMVGQLRIFAHARQSPAGVTITTIHSTPNRDTEIWQLQQLLSSDETKVRLQAVSDLGDMDESLATEGLLQALKDPEPSIRIEAVTLLGESRDASIVPHIELMLDDTDIKVQRAAIFALGDIGTDNAKQVLQKILQHPAPVLRKTAAKALEYLAPE